ncbi:MAG: septal ring lytic transglycosylase RlpA family protein [Campylobacterales bacterium]|nr:septal ring lytic transglycosylase RlpA family protein [Campylobacterales bacterium]
MRTTFLLCLIFLLGGCGSVTQPTLTPKPAPKKDLQTKKFKVHKFQEGIASYYSNKFHCRLTACGEPYNKNKLTAAHNSLPLGTLVKVTRVANGKSVFVRINDRMARHNKRAIDLSFRAAQEIGLIRAGIGKVKVEVCRT